MSVVPPVTVFMTVYNAMPFLAASVLSILEQSFKDFCLLIIDDGSTDGSAAYLSQLTDTRVQLVMLPHQGTGAASNVALDACESEFLARMDADDIAMPNRLTEQLAYLRRHPDIIAVGTQFKYIGSSGGGAPSPQLPLHHGDIRRYLLRGRLCLLQPSLMFRTAALRGIGGYRIRGMGEDWDMFLRLSESGRLANLSGVHYLWRQHPGNADFWRLIEYNIGTAYACHCARLRMGGKAEPTFEEFRRVSDRRLWRRLARFMDVYAFSQYRRSLAEIADARKLRGYSRLLYSMVWSPRRTLSRAFRMVSTLVHPPIGRAGSG